MTKSEMQSRIERLLEGEEAGSAAWRWLGIKLLEAAPGRTLCEMPVTEDMRNHQGVCHGGFITALADSAMGSALATVLPEGERHMSFDLKLSLMRTVRVGETLRAEGTVLHAGRRTAVGECRLRVEGKLVATASGSFIVHRPEQTD